MGVHDLCSLAIQGRSNLTALAIARDLQARSGWSLKKIIRGLRPLQQVTIQLASQQLNAEPALPDSTSPTYSTSSAKGTKEANSGQVTRVGGRFLVRCSASRTRSARPSAHGSSPPMCVERVLFALVANRCMDPMSELSAAEWASCDAAIPGLAGMDDDQAYRAMDVLVEADAQAKASQPANLGPPTAEPGAWASRNAPSGGRGSHDLPQCRLPVSDLQPRRRPRRRRRQTDMAAAETGR